MPKKLNVLGMDMGRIGFSLFSRARRKISEAQLNLQLESEGPAVELMQG
jgi:hypothetical protein